MKRIFTNKIWIVAAVMAVTVFLSSIPLLLPGTHAGHDLGFHLYRIVSVSKAIAEHSFPVRIYFDRFNGYGYGSPLFYCDFFLYFPALLHNLLGLDFTASWNALLFLLNSMTFLVSYYSYKTISRSFTIGLTASALYTLTTYRLLDLYTRAAIGESCALVFLPLILCGFERILRNERTGWITLALGYTGVLMSHTLSFLMALLIGAVFCLLHFKKILEKEHLISILKAALLSIGCTAWYLIPFLRSVFLPLQAKSDYPDFFRTSLSLSDLFDFSLKGAASGEIYKGLLSSSTGYGITKTPGPLILLGSILFFILWIRSLQSGETSPESKPSYLLFGWLTIILMSDMIPWELLQGLPVFSFFRSFQFIWRFNMVVVLLLSYSAAFGFCSLAHRRKFLLSLVPIGIIVFSLFFYQTYLTQTRVFTDDNMPLLTDELYLFTGNDLSSREPFESNGDALSVNDVLKEKGVAFTYSVLPPSDGSPLYIDVPLNYYPGYTAKVNDTTEKVTYSDTGIVRLFVPNNASSGTVSVSYRESPLFLLADVISLISWIFLCTYLLKKRNS